MSTSQRALLAGLAAFATYFFVMLVMLIFGQALLPPVRLLIALAIAGLAGWYTWRRSSGHDFASLIGAIFRGAIITGCIFFFLGFVGPMILTPGANQGPMLGIFITGPLGVLLGGVGGAVVWSRRRRAVST